MKKIIASISIFLVAAAWLVVFVPAPTAQAAPCKGTSPLFPRWYDDLCDKDDDTKVMAPNEGGVNGSKTADDTAKNFGVWLSIIAMNVVKMIMVVVGYVSLAFIIWGGFKYMLSGDNSSGTVAARKTIQNAVIGLVISIMSIAIISLVTRAVTGGGSSSGTPASSTGAPDDNGIAPDPSSDSVEGGS